ncbi:MAG: transcription elongation factor GreA [Pyramidobacter sp.]|nr:transcription elongation factor GreA [Pyramidobacter sp.]MBP3751797.1 transcription elongation factor GreA [Pyramidobacter sp.]MBP3837273.1 transcription elongation factor GreA [Pyramidobacter sp.]MBP3848570.1 transcription elongation factor GreA [Pyramidobacter sp.]MBQ4490391.1 transcription elongation factor GreA [Pyramidobacter sp.]
MAERKHNDDAVLMTQEGFDKLTSELKQLRSEERYKIARRIEEARSFGDLSENAEYAAAKEDQAKLEGKILAMEQQLSKAKIIDSSSIDNSHVSVGTTVTIQDITHNKEFVYSLVSSEESDPENGLISSVSPVGRALMNKKVGDEVSVKVPVGLRKLRILSISVK